MAFEASDPRSYHLPSVQSFPAFRCFPTKLKQALVLPLLKKNNLDPETASSYRPISNLPYILRTCGCQAFLLASVPSQSPTSSTVRLPPFPLYRNGCVVVHNDVVRSTDNGQVSLLVLLDLSAAFDTVDHQILLSVLSDRFAVSNNALTWFTSYLTDRTQQFMYAGSCTSSFTVDSYKDQFWDP